ncbi:MAG: 2-isopropylmalate synthase [Cyanobacteria bacterium J06560_5]
MEKIDLIVADETLRDGEQQVGLFFEDKAELARLIAQTGVQQIALMPSIHATESELVKTLASKHLRSQIVASTMMQQAAIDQAKACGVKQIILFHAVSDRLLFLRDPAITQNPAFEGQTIESNIPFDVIKTSRQKMLNNALKHIQYATDQGLQVCFAAEDASRADFHFLVEAINTFAPHIEQFLLCDTVGLLTPEKTYVWIRDLLESVTGAVSLSVHFHNDMGLALENTIQAVRAGASGISGTMGGIGERAGNAPLEQVLWGLKVRFGWEVNGIDYQALDRVVAYLNQRGYRPHSPYSQAAQRHESGIHVSALLRDHQSYAIFPHGQPEIWFGKYSGTSNWRYLFEQHLSRTLTHCEYERLRHFIKTTAMAHKRSYSVEQVLALLEQQQVLAQLDIEHAEG